MNTKIATALLLLAGLTAGAHAGGASTTRWSVTIGNERPAPREVVVVRHEPPPRVVYVEKGHCRGRGHGHAYGHRHGHGRDVVYVVEKPAPRCDRSIHLTILPHRDEVDRPDREDRDEERVIERRDDRGGERVAFEDGRGRGRGR